MRLSEQQLEALETDGYLILEAVFSASEVHAIRTRLGPLFEHDCPENVAEKHSGAVRTAMGLHLRDPLIGALVRHPRLVGPALQVLEEPVYVQQVKVNVKAAFSGEVWQWHHDFATHHQEDGVPRPRALNLHVFLDPVTEFNGPLYVLPGSHRMGEQPAHLDSTTTSYPLWVVDTDAVRRVAVQTGIVSATGRPGTVLLFHDTLVHGSPGNLSPWDRAIFSLIVNPVSNAYRTTARPDHMHHRDLTPLTPLDDDCLRAH